NYYGPSTEKIVKEFQKYYGLKETGVVEDETFKKIDEILNSPFQNGKNHQDTIQLKKDLERLGFKVSNNPNTRYGPGTTRKVKEFQSYYNLIVNGIVDEVTKKKLDSLLDSPLQRGRSHKDVVQLKEDLMTLGYGSFRYKNESYGPSTEESVRLFQEVNNLPISGIAEENTLAKIKDLIKKGNFEPVEITTYTTYDITLEQQLQKQ